MIICNNSNSSGELRICEWVSLDYHSTDPLQNLKDRRDAHYSEATTSVAIEDDYAVL